MENELINDVVDWIVTCSCEDICQICAYLNDENNKKFFEMYIDDYLNDGNCFYHAKDKQLACRTGIIKFFEERMKKND